MTAPSACSFSSPISRVISARSISSRKGRLRGRRDRPRRRFPWRDILVVHGLLHDIGTGLFGSAVIEDSRWGSSPGRSCSSCPSWVALYYLCAYLFWSNWLFLLGSQILVVTGSLFVVHYRLGLIPLVLLLLAALFHRPTVIRAVAFTSLSSCS